MKKILSILLSAILAVSVFGISASARLLGDVDGDKKTNPIDALTILRYSVGLTDTIDEKLADVNSDGTVNSADALVVLRMCVGLYTGPTEVDLKPEIIDPIMKTGKFTLSIIVDTEDENGKPVSIPSTIMVSGNNMCTSMKYSGMNVRLLILNGKVYMVVPDLKVYMEMSEEDIGGLDFGNMTFDDNSTYVGSFYSTYGGKTYTVDSYKAEDGSVTDYYFLDGKWAMVGEHSAKPEAAQKITDFKAGVNESYFSLKGLVKIDPSMLG